jgi:hypothetical protein
MGSATFSVAWIAVSVSVFMLLGVFDILIAYPPPTQHVKSIRAAKLENGRVSTFMDGWVLPTVTGGGEGLRNIGDVITNPGDAPLGISPVAAKQPMPPSWRAVIIDGVYGIGAVSGNKIHVIPRNICMRVLGVQLYAQWIPDTTYLPCAVPLYCGDLKTFIVVQCMTIAEVVGAANVTVLTPFNSNVL